LCVKMMFIDFIIMVVIIQKIVHVMPIVLLCYDLCQLLDLLWELAHLPMLKTSLIELALEEHLAVLTDPFAIKEQVKKHYVIKCVEDIREVPMFCCDLFLFLSMGEH